MVTCFSSHVPYKGAGVAQGESDLTGVVVLPGEFFRVRIGEGN